MLKRRKYQARYYVETKIEYEIVVAISVIRFVLRHSITADVLIYIQQADLMFSYRTLMKYEVSKSPW